MKHTELKKWRTSMGWTQDFTAFFLGIPYETYRSLETGRRTIRADLRDRFTERRRGRWKHFTATAINNSYRRFIRKRTRLHILDIGCG